MTTEHGWKGRISPEEADVVAEAFDSLPAKRFHTGVASLLENGAKYVLYDATMCVVCPRPTEPNYDGDAFKIDHRAVRAYVRSTKTSGMFPGGVFIIPTVLLSIFSDAAKAAARGPTATRSVQAAEIIESLIQKTGNAITCDDVLDAMANADAGIFLSLIVHLFPVVDADPRAVVKSAASGAARQVPLPPAKNHVSSATFIFDVK